MGTVSLKPEAASRSIGMLRTAMGPDPAVADVHARLKGNMGNGSQPVSDCCDDLSRHHRRSCDARELRIVALSHSDLHVGLGLTTRKNAELCLSGRRGSAGCNAKDVREIILAPVREHSRDEAHERSNCDGPYLDQAAPATNENRAAVASEDGDAA